MAWHKHDSSNPQPGAPASAQDGDFIIDGSNTTVSGKPAIDTQLARFSVGQNSTMLYSGLVNGQKGNTVWVKGGDYERFTFDARDVFGVPGNPVKIVNYGGQVKSRRFSWLYTEHIKISGKYANGFGDVSFRGHDVGYTNSKEKYGWYADNKWYGTLTTYSGGTVMRYGDILWSFSGVNPITGNNCHDVELEYFGIGNGGFTGLMIKTNGSLLPMYNFKIHDGAIFDTDAESTYFGYGGIGSNFDTQVQHEIINFEMYNCRLLRAGGEAVQMTPCREVNFHNNVVIASGCNWRNAWSQSQDGLLQLNPIGSNWFHHNILTGGRVVGAFSPDVISPLLAAHQAYNPPVFEITDNYFGDSHGGNIYYGRGYNQDSYTVRRFNRNFLDESKNRTDELTGGTTYPTWFDKQSAWINFSNQGLGAYEFLNNKIYPQKVMPGNSSTVSSSGNVSEAPDKPAYNNSGYPAGWDYSLFSHYTAKYFEVWAAINPGDIVKYTNKAMTPVYYPAGTRVRVGINNLGTRFYELNVGQTGVDGSGDPIIPGAENSDTAWTEIANPADDYTLVEGSTYEQLGIGLTDVPIVLPPEPPSTHISNKGRRLMI
ncbi:MAG: hypothetical protein HC819_14800 [Cyclobacteriaceae bacterium]|nr:hypothetical protein [Cyclobacteriaceae bacterium]